MNAPVSISKRVPVVIRIVRHVEAQCHGVVVAKCGRNPVVLIGVRACVHKTFGLCSSPAERFVMGSIPIQSTTYLNIYKISITNMKLYVVRNIKTGQYFRSIGYGGSGDNWVDTLDKAKFYPKISAAKGRVTFYYNPPQSKRNAPVCDILEFTIEPEQAVVISYIDEVIANAKKRAEKELKDQLVRKAEKLKELERQQADLLYQIRSLQTS